MNTHTQQEVNPLIFNLYAQADCAMIKEFSYQVLQFLSNNKDHVKYYLGNCSICCLSINALFDRRV